jgi:ATP-dependent RNA helicase SUPV3L1/SUV3
MHKWNGTQEIRLPTPQIKQIAGRAGRYGVHTSPTAPDDASATATTTNGEATTLDEADMTILREAMAEPTVQVTQASLAATYEASRDVEALLPAGTPHSKIFSLVEAVSLTTPHYRGVGHSGWGEISDKISAIEPLSFKERYLFGTAPVNLRDPKVVATLISFVESFAAGRQIIMEEWAVEAGVRASLDRVEKARRAKQQLAIRGTGPQVAGVYNPEFLMGLESSHRCLTLYLWLSYRQSTIFCDREAARILRKQIESGIDFVLGGMKFSKLERGSKSKRYKSKMARGDAAISADQAGSKSQMHSSL